MKKHGDLFTSIVDRERLQRGVWEPSRYRDNGKGAVLADYVVVERVNGKTSASSAVRFAPIEYRHIPGGNLFTFILESVAVPCRDVVGVVGEQALLLGTMRAYLGNIIVTPQADWLGLSTPVQFPVKSEFICINPQDGLVYFWWAYLKSPSFLQGLPAGSGGTRPRLHPEALLQTPVNVPPLEVRRLVHGKLTAHAERAWREYMAVEELIKSMGE
jgi:hypothetical protein